MRYFNNSKSKNGLPAGRQGLALIELLVAATIIVLLSSMMLLNVRGGQKQFALTRSANKMAQDIRRAQEMTMSMKEYICPTANLRGYGMNMSKSDPIYYLVAVCDGTTSVLETLTFEKGVKFQDLSYYKSGQWQTDIASLELYFTPPDPTVGLTAGAERIRITLSLETDQTKTKKILLNTAGLIEIQ